MALTVKDILELPCGQKMTLIAGRGGLGRPVVTVEIADYEFDPDVDYDAPAGMDTNGFIITSFLFAKNDPSLILKSIRQMHEIGMACVAFKRIIYAELPADVIAFADKNDFPVFTMENDLWFENIIFDIMYAVQFDDKVYLSEMIKGFSDGSRRKPALPAFPESPVKRCAVMDIAHTHRNILWDSQQFKSFLLNQSMTLVILPC